MIDRVEYLMRLTHDHCDTGDEIARRQYQERATHIENGEKLLTLAQGLVALLQQDLVRFGARNPNTERERISQHQPAGPSQGSMPRVVQKGPAATG